MSNRGLDQERLEYIKGRINSQTQRVELTAWPRAEKILYKVSLEVDWVRFSTLNHRTRAEQRQKEHSLGRPDLFSADPLGTQAQNAQMQIIASQDGFADLCTDIGERGQREPAVVTAEGVLINGNRRVAALRRMLHDDHNLNCKYVQCLVLPDDANHDEILLLETELQIARDFKQEYSWINEALLIEELYEKNARSYQHVAKIMHRNTREVQDAHDKLKQVYQLVELSQGAKQLADFKDHESAFLELVNHIRNRPGTHGDSVRDVYYLGTLTGVNYRNLRHLRRDDATARVDVELQHDDRYTPLVSAAREAAIADTPAASVLDDVLGGANQPSCTRTVLEYLARLDKKQPVLLTSGDTADYQDLCDLAKQAIDRVADDAQDANDAHEAAHAPLVALERAAKATHKAMSTIEAARLMPEWDESTFQDRLSAFLAAVGQLTERR